MYLCGVSVYKAVTNKVIAPHIPKILAYFTEYISKGDTLLHGNYYPGSWMSKANHTYLIDPEFSFMGFSEFDNGVMVTHTIMISMNIDCLETIKNRYPKTLNANLLAKAAGIEIMRRLIGLAKSPLKRAIEEKKLLLKVARTLILN